MTRFDLTPAYGRDYATAREAKRAWREGRDWLGPIELGYKPVNINQLPKPCTVALHYNRHTRVADVRVHVGAKATMPIMGRVITPLKPPRNNVCEVIEFKKR